VTPATTIGGASYAWGQNVRWGDTIVGGQVVYTNNIVWGTSFDGNPF
jgi:hypothetical protein